MTGAFYRQNAPWLAAAFAMAFASSFGQTFFISLFAGGIRADYGLSDGGWGGIYTAATLGSALVLSQAGRLADSVAPRRLVLGIAGLYLAAILAMALGEAIWLLLFAVFGLRLAGQGLISHLSMSMTARWFRANRGRALAIVVLGYPAGEALLPPLGVALIGWIGWRGGWLVMGAVLAAVIVPLILALLARGDRVPSGAPSGEGPAGSAAGLDGRHWRQREVLMHWSFWALMPGVLAPSFIGTVVFFHQVHLAELRGWDLSVMALGYPAYAAVSVALSLVSGPLIDRVGPLALLPFYLLPIGASVSALMLPGGEAVWFLTLIGIGVSQGVVITVHGALWPTIYGTDRIGGVKALAVSGMVVSTALGPGITGLAIDLGYPLPSQAPFMAAWCVIASIGIAAVVPRLAARLRGAESAAIGVPDTAAPSGPPEEPTARARR